MSARRARPLSQAPTSSGASCARPEGRHAAFNRRGHQPDHRHGSSTGRFNLGTALAYTLDHWDGLVLFAGDGRVEMDSNSIENRIRPVTLGRKNALFAGHDEGGQSWARFASVIETCKLNGVEPYAWLKATLEAIATGHPKADIDALLPWNFGEAAVKAAA